MELYISLKLNKNTGGDTLVARYSYFTFLLS